MVSKKDKDAEAGLQVIAILGIFWTAGFFYMGSNGSLSGIGMGAFSISCCNVINLVLTIIFFASWRYTVRENRVKDFLDEHFMSNDSVSITFLMDKFKLQNSAASKALAVWIIESKVKGDIDQKTGIFTKEPVEKDSSEKIDIEADEISEKTDKLLMYCPDCGEEISIGIGHTRNYCTNCEKFI